MDRAELPALLATTAQAHHQAFIETAGEDPEWPMWYAGYMQEDLNRILGTSLTKSDLVFHLVDLERLRVGDAPDSPWPEFYASRLVARLDAGDL